MAKGEETGERYSMGEINWIFTLTHTQALNPNNKLRLQLKDNCFVFLLFAIENKSRDVGQDGNNTNDNAKLDTQLFSFAVRNIEKIQIKTR